MAITEVRRTGWGGRIKESIKGILIGGVLFVAGFPILWKNEDNSVRNIRAIAEAKKSAVSVDAATVAPANEGKLVHLTGPLATTDTLVDAEFGLSLNTIRLERTAEMYQWKEESSSKTKKSAGGSETTETTYTYHKVWEEGRIDSSGFKESGHDNPQPAFASQESTAENVTLKAYRLSPTLIGQYHDRTPVKVAPDALPPALAGKFKGLADGGLYLGDAPDSPKVGDQRIHFYEHKPGPASLIARQTGEALSGHAAASGKNIEWLYPGQHTIEAICGFKTRENTILTWILRAVGFVCMWIGLGLILRPLRVLADVVPLIGSIVGFGLGFFSFLGAFVCATTTIAVAWVAVRPWTALPAVAGIVLLIVMLRRNRREAAVAAPAGFPPPPPPAG